MKIILFSLLIFVFLNTLDARSAEIHAGKNEIFITGKISEGDSDKLIIALKNHRELSDSKSKTFPPTIWLESSGGDVVEAMKMGNIVRRSLITVITTKCYSACTFIALSSVEPLLSEDTGIHRPYFEQKYFSNLSASEAEKEYKRLGKVCRRYLLDIGVINEIIDKMFSVPSDEIYILSNSEYLSLSKRSPFYDEWLKSKCGSMSDDEFFDLRIFEQGGGTKNIGYHNYLSDKYEKIGNCEELAIKEQYGKFLDELIFKNP